MKKSSKAKSKTNSFEPGEQVRVGPLHHSKPVVAIGEREGGDLLDGKPHPVPASAKLTYRNGPLIQNVEVFTIFWEKLWRQISKNSSWPPLMHFPRYLTANTKTEATSIILVHGFNVSFDHSTTFYENFCGKLFNGPDSLGLCILCDWPSLGTVVGYERRI